MKVALLVVVLAALTLPTRSHGSDVELVLQCGRRGYKGAADVSVSVDPRIAELNLGAMPTLDIWQHDGVAFLRFDLSRLPRNANVKKATLEMFAVSCGFSKPEIARRWTVKVYQCTESWSEGTGRTTDQNQTGATLATANGSVAWKRAKPIGSAGAVLGSTIIHGEMRNWVRWDLNRSAVQRWISHGDENYGVVVWGRAPGKAVSFASRESDDVAHRPILRLELSMPDSEIATLEHEFGSLSEARQIPNLPRLAAPIEVKLAVVHAGQTGARDEKLVERFRKALDGIRKSCPKESRDEIARATCAAWLAAAKRGVEISLLDLIEAFETMARDNEGNFRFADLAAGWVLVASSPDPKP